MTPLVDSPQAESQCWSLPATAVDECQAALQQNILLDASWCGVEGTFEGTLIPWCYHNPSGVGSSGLSHPSMVFGVLMEVQGYLISPLVDLLG